MHHVTPFPLGWTKWLFSVKKKSSAQSLLNFHKFDKKLSSGFVHNSWLSERARHGMARYHIFHKEQGMAWQGIAYFTKSKVSAERNREYAIVSRMYNDCSFPEYVAQIVL